MKIELLTTEVGAEGRRLASLTFGLRPWFGGASGDLPNDSAAQNSKFSIINIITPRQGDLRLLGPPSGQVAGGGARTRDKRMPAELRADSLATVPPTRSRSERDLTSRSNICCRCDVHIEHCLVLNVFLFSAPTPCVTILGTFMALTPCTIIGAFMALTPCAVLDAFMAFTPCTILGAFMALTTMHSIRCLHYALYSALSWRLHHALYSPLSWRLHHALYLALKPCTILGAFMALTSCTILSAFMALTPCTTFGAYTMPYIQRFHGAYTIQYIRRLYHALHSVLTACAFRRLQHVFSTCTMHLRLSGGLQHEQFGA
ncbi:hypothetical protein PoB_005893900 [Plakobranchus ocellatus]|uniref:G-protein coupled receptors family 1 profile domain-containing protein n=1 Tax=Plakobranchus ocellatus TaxID=259542 RepID=A0AAV4CI48_9GAST|nr:hypothetical protein PoB_005893900 [Plakobranchus ocellatus]